MKVGLIMAGGGGRGAYQIGALKAISKYFKPEEFEIISAASIGAINTYAYSSGNIDYLEKKWRSVNNVSENIATTDILKSDYLHEAIAELSKSRVLKDNLYVPLLAIREKKVVYFNVSEITEHQDVDTFLHASVAIPLCVRPVKIGNVQYYDGAVVDSIPVQPLLDKELDYIICVYFDKASRVIDLSGLRKKTIKVCFEDQARASTAVILNKKNIAQMITKGERQTSQILDFAFKNGKENVPAVLQAISALGQMELGKPVMQLTSSRALSALNKIAKLFFKTK